ncbi:hypothetical protein [Oceanobacillus sp. CAU 1775]
MMDNVWMYILIGIIIAVCIFGVIATLRVSKRKERLQEERRRRGDTFEDEVERSHEYEERSLRRNLPNLIRIVVIGIVVFAIAYYVIGYFSG